VVGGFGSAVLDCAATGPASCPPITRLGLPDAWIYQDSRSRQLAEAGLDRASLVKAFRAAATHATDAEV
jgi:deoxyxylulose-5-phosphate synthase